MDRGVACGPWRRLWTGRRRWAGGVINGQRIQRLGHVGDEVVRVFKPDRKSDGTGIDTGAHERTVVELPVRGGCHVADLGMGATERGRDRADAQAVGKLHSSGPAAMRGYGDDRAEPGAFRPGVEEPPCHFMPPVLWQPRVDPADRRVAGERGREDHCVRRAG